MMSRMYELTEVQVEALRQLVQRETFGDGDLARTEVMEEREMVASDRTVEEIYRVVRRHVTDEQMDAIVGDLLQVDGKFRDTVRRLAALDARVKDERSV